MINVYLDEEGDSVKVNFIELTNFRGIQKQRITFENKNFVALIETMVAEKQAY